MSDIIKKKMSISILATAILLFTFYCYFFTMENLLVAIWEQIITKNFDIAFHAGRNSHLACLLLSILVLLISPLYIKFWGWLSGFRVKHNNLFFKIITNLHFVAFFGMLFCFAGEFLVGYICNIKLKLDFWDYSIIKIGNIPLNLMGQIELFHAPIWYIVGLLIFPVLKTFFHYDNKLAKTFYKSMESWFNILIKGKGDYFNFDMDYYKLSIKKDK